MYSVLTYVPLWRRRVRAVEPERWTRLLARSPRSLARAPNAQPLELRIEPELLQYDYLRVGNVAQGALCSQRFLGLLAQAGVPFSSYPVEVFDTRTPLHARVGEPSLTQRYFFWMTEQLEDAIDEERSGWWRARTDGKRQLVSLVLRSKHESATVPVIVPAGTQLYLVHHELRAQIQAAELTGMAFIPLDTVFDPALGVSVVARKQQLEQNPDDVYLWYDLGLSWWRLHQPRRAVEAFDRALLLKPDFVEADAMRRRALVDFKRDEGHALGREGPG